ncbi:hypothetical protein EBU94_09640 [bacterium]|nr:hypothetical protein [bacterium]
MADVQVIDPYRSIAKPSNIKPPLTMVLNSVDSHVGYMQGVPSSYNKPEVYVLLSALPDELRNRVALAVQALKSSL